VTERGLCDRNGGVFLTAERQGGETGTTCHLPHGKCGLLTKNRVHVRR
jgi:putative hemolysin